MYGRRHGQYLKAVCGWVIKECGVVGGGGGGGNVKKFWVFEPFVLGLDFVFWGGANYLSTRFFLGANFSGAPQIRFFFFFVWVGSPVFLLSFGEKGGSTDST